MVSVLQTVFSLSKFQTRYGILSREHSASCTFALPADCIECQMHKVADGLLSGRYSHPAPYASGTPSHRSSPLRHPSPTPVFQQGIKPTSFKALIGKSHPEFFTYLVSTLRRDMHKYQDRSDAGEILMCLPFRSTLMRTPTRSYCYLFVWNGTTPTVRGL